MPVSNFSIKLRNKFKLILCPAICHRERQSSPCAWLRLSLSSAPYFFSLCLRGSAWMTKHLIRATWLAACLVHVANAFRATHAQGKCTRATQTRAGEVRTCYLQHAYARAFANGMRQGGKGGLSSFQSPSHGFISLPGALPRGKSIAAGLISVRAWEWQSIEAEFERN